MGLYVGALARSYDDNRRTVAAPNVSAGDGGPVNVLLLGSDSRAEDGEPAVGTEDNNSEASTSSLSVISVGFFKSPASV